MNYKLFNAARNKSVMNYQEGRFDMELESDVPSSDGKRIMRLTSCPRHSHDEDVRPISLPDISLKNTASTVSYMFIIKSFLLIFVSKDIRIVF